MIDKKIYDLDYIRELQARYKTDPGLLERVLYAFGLLEALVKVGMKFAFKGGTSLMLLLDHPIRLSTDIDIIVDPGIDVESYIEQAGTIFPFLRKEEDIRKGRNNIEKRHFKFIYYSPVRQREFYILLDIVFMESPYNQIVTKPIRNDLLVTAPEDLLVTMPTMECILGDKLTAFAPHTTGVLLGEGKELEIAKQMFDVATLAERMQDQKQFRATYDRAVVEELQRVLQETMIRDMEGYTGWYLQDEGMSLNKLWTQALKKEDGSANPEELQIISPYRGEFYGTDALNQWMQGVFNTYWSHKYNLDGVSPFDKVIQFRNRPRSDMAYVYNDETKQNERAEVFNGEIGIAVIHGLDYPNQWYRRMSQLEHIQVRFSNQNRRKLRYNYGKKLGKDEKGRWIPEQKVQENLELAYAISVHKSQGSEFDYVYIVIPKRDSHLLSMELLYTAITRAQKHVTIFLQDDIGTLTNLGHLEKSAVRRINSSIFEFKPLPEELLYTHNWYADEKKLATLSEYFVRSKSEVIIANMLVDRDIPFKYEEPLYAADGTIYLPDFTVTFRGETYYWEHVGMLDRPDYKAHWEKKKKWYEKNFPGQLVVTYEGKNLSQDALEIIKAHL